MIERDYFMRSIQMLTAALVSILLKKDSKQYTEAKEEIGEIGEKLIGIKWSVFRAFTHEHMTDLLGDEETLTKMFAAAELFREESDILYEEGKENESILQKMKSFSLFIKLINKDKRLLKLLSIDKYASLLKRLEEFELPALLELKRFRYYEMSAEFGKAKDILDELIDNEPGLIPDAIPCYRRLSNLTDAEIMQNGISKSEIENTLRKLESQLNKQKQVN